MPELPEVETIVRELNKEVLQRTFLDVWSDAKSIIKNSTFAVFKKKIVGRKIVGVRRRAKNILIDLDQGRVLLIHQKMTGHVLLGRWQLEKGSWVAEEKGALSDDPMNKFLHLVFELDDGRQLALSDVRKFSKVELWEREALESSESYSKIGPEPLDKSFNLGKFINLFRGKRGNIKKILMDQNFISGIGNIYASEILFAAGVDPRRESSSLGRKELEAIYRAIRKILTASIAVKGDSFSDFRTLSGGKGGFQKIAKVYHHEGDRCVNCGGKIKRITQGGRSTFFCPACQK